MTDEEETNCGDMSGSASTHSVGGRRMDKGDVANQLYSLRTILEEQLSGNYVGWSEFKTQFDDILITKVLGSSDATVEVVPLTQTQLQGFIDTSLSLTWNYTEQSSTVFFVPRLITDLLQMASEAIHRRQEEERARHESELAEQLRNMHNAIERMQAEVMTFPDFRQTNRSLVITDGAVMTTDFVAPENGYVTGNARLVEGANYLTFAVYVNGKSYQTAGHGRSVHIPVFIPLRRGDAFRASGGANHYFCFIPCRGFSE